ncbi:MAG TPA: acetyl-CoA carboxylase biotin carboxylase subunit [Gaiellaceae bacterium]|nr:acetyl-CoA carboxylase biotin carboxylase subunit [Gaiellaceae bacterium]
MARSSPPFSKVLVANRGEIAVRVFRTLRELGIGTVAVYSEADRGSLHVEVADEAYLLGPGPAAESYLRGERIVEAAQRAGAEAIHPGYGFLSENARFARQVAEAGLVWIGPPPEAIEAMGSKIAARARMREAGVPVIPGTAEPARSVDDVRAAAEEVGYPVAIKAAAGGGGKGFRIAAGPEEVERAYEAARREGQAYFADPTVYVERYLDDPRHVEVQVLADAHGTVVHLGERDCTIQRRHQKLVEETPSPAVDAALRERIGRLAVEAARAVGYVSAGTIEGLLDRDGNYYFLEMNTRLQVEHTVTEAVTGIDIVREQVLIAAGEPLSFAQEDVSLRGHAIECRINAEDAARGFLPCPGRITAYREPAGIGVRVDSGVRAGSEVSDLYDPLVAKLVVHDVDREHARRRMLRALEEYVIEGPTTLLGFHRALLESPCFVQAGTCRGVVESKELAQRAKKLEQQLSHRATRLAGPPDGAGAREQLLALEVDGRRHEIRLLRAEPPWAELARRHRRRGHGLTGAQTGSIVSPMQGVVLAVEVTEGQEVEAGDVICVVEAMKMENEIVSHRDGVVAELRVAPGQQVASGQLLCVVRDG